MAIGELRSNKIRPGDGAACFTGYMVTMRVSVFTLHSGYFAWYPSLEGCVNHRKGLH